MRAVLARRLCVQARTGQCAFCRRPAGALNGQTFTDPVALFLEPRHRRPARLGMSDQIGPDHRGKEPRHLRSTGHGAAALAYERLVTGIHNEDTIEQYRISGMASAGCSTRGGGSIAGLMLRETAQRWVARAVSGRGDARSSPRQRLLDPETESPNLTYQPERLSMEKVEDEAFTRRTASASSPCAISNHGHPRKLNLYGETGLLSTSEGSRILQARERRG